MSNDKTIFVIYAGERALKSCMSLAEVRAYITWNQKDHKDDLHFEVWE